MTFIEDDPDFFHSMTFGDGVTAEFNNISTVMFYNSDGERIMQLDPGDMMMLYAAYRAMVREGLEEEAWHGEE